MGFLIKMCTLINGMRNRQVAKKGSNTRLHNESFVLIVPSFNHGTFQPLI